MDDKKKLAHDLAIAAATVCALKNFDQEVTGETSEDKRSRFADYLLDEYEHYFDRFSESVNK